MSQIQKPPIRENLSPPVNPPTTQSETQGYASLGCINLHNWVDGICSRCGAEKTEMPLMALSESGSPPHDDPECYPVHCMNPEAALKVLKAQLDAAIERSRTANSAFDAIIQEVPSGLPSS